MLTHTLRISLLGLMLVTTPAMAESPFTSEELTEIANVQAFVIECTERGLTPPNALGELDNIILQISQLPDINTKLFMNLSENKIIELDERKDGQLLESCRALHEHTIRWSMKYWSMYQKHNSE